MTFGNHPVCSQPFLSFIKSDDPRLRMGLQSPWVQEVEACCSFGPSPGESPEICEAKLDAVWRDPLIQQRWNKAPETLASEIEKLQKLAQQFGKPSFKPLYSDLLPPAEEAGAGEAIATLGLLACVGLGAFVLAWGNLAHNSEQTNSWFRDGRRPYPESLATLPPAPPIDFDTKDFKPRPDRDLDPRPKPLDRLPPPPIDLPRPRRRPDCDPSQSIPLTDSRGLFFDDVVQRFAGGASMLYYLWSPSENSYVRVYITKISLEMALAALPTDEDNKNTWIGQGIHRAGLPFVIFIAETESCEVLGTSLGIIKKSDELDLTPYRKYVYARVWKFPDVDLRLKNLSLAFYFNSVLYLNQVGLLKNSSPNRPMITDIKPDILASIRNHLDIDGTVYLQEAIKGVKPRVAWNQVSVQEAIYTLRLIPDTRMPKD